MHDIRFIREHPQAFDAGLRKRNLPPMSTELLTCVCWKMLNSTKVCE